MNNTMDCEVCLRCVSMYKCPKCLLKYCSSGCYKKHTSSSEDECETKRRKRAQEEGVETAAIKDVNGIQEQTYFVGSSINDQKEEERDDKMEAEDRVPLNKLELLRSDRGLLDCLRNPHLRNLIATLDRSSNPSADILSAMMEPIFVEFADQCLGVVETSTSSHS